MKCRCGCFFVYNKYKCVSGQHLKHMLMIDVSDAVSYLELSYVAGVRFLRVSLFDAAVVKVLRFGMRTILLMEYHRTRIVRTVAALSIDEFMSKGPYYIMSLIKERSRHEVHSLAFDNIS